MKHVRMTNRLHKKLPATPVLLGFCLIICTSFGLQAQFTFQPPAITTFPVGPLCAQSVAGANPVPTVTVTTPGATLTVSQFDAAATGFPATDLWPAPTLNLVIHWHVEDNFGNSATFFFSVSFVDQSAPVLNNLPPASASYNSIVQVPPPPAVTATDNCPPGNISVNYNPGTPPDTCQAGVFTRTWTATDASGNTAVFTQTITIAADVNPPAISGFPQNGSANCKQLATAYPAWLATQMANFTAVDVSGIKSYTNNAPPSFPSGCTVPITVTFRATDNCNSHTTTTAVFTTSDNQPPVVTALAKDTVAYCAPSNNHLTQLGAWIHQHGYAQVTDSCSVPLVYKMEIDSTAQDSAQVVAAFLASFANGCDTQMIGTKTYPKVRGKVTVDFYAEDACGNKVFVDRATFGAIDTLPPVISGSNALEQCGSNNDNANLQAWIDAHGNATATDECSATTWTNFSFLTSTGQSGTGVFNGGPYPQVQPNTCDWHVDVTFRATDDCGNTGSKVLRFEIQDTQIPVIAGFPDTVTLSCPNPVPTLLPAFLSDNCDTSLVIAYTFTTSDSLCPGNYTMTVNWSATDDCNNTGTAFQTVLVRDTEGPQFTLVPGPVTFRCDTFVLPPFPVMGIGITATDNCSQAMSITSADVSQQDPDPGLCGHYTYNITRTFTATDACGNTSTATQLISVIDNLGPAPGGLLDTTLACDAQPFVTPPPAPVDACYGPTAAPFFVNDIVTNGICDDSYTLTRNWQAQDVCANTSIIPQIIHVVDTVSPVLTNIPPDVTVECDAIPVAPPTSSFNPIDNCDETVTVTLNETEIRNPDLADCSHWTNYLIRREWTATDNCGNSTVYTQNISVQDDTGPVIVTVPMVMLPAEQGLCGATVGIPAPVSVFDKCTSLSSDIVLKDTVALVNTSGGPNNTTPVDTVVLQWPSPNLPPSLPATGNATLKIDLKIADSEGPTEYFRVYGENGFPIGQTNPNVPPVQCGNSSTTFNIPATEINNWLADGQLVLILAPNGTGSDAINALATCSGGKVFAELSYPVANPQIAIDLLYSLDGDTAVVFPPPGGFFLDVGTHTVVYTAIDCAGNSTTATTTIEVEDLQAPVVTPPPADTFYVGQSGCEAVVTLPFPTITDNCNVSGHLVQASANLPVIFENDPNAGLIPKDVTLSISGLMPNAVTPGVLEIRHKGDNDNVLGGEFFKVYDEFNAYLTATTEGTVPGQCSLFHETIVNVSANTINSWAAGNFTASFKLEANDDAGSFTDFIDPCAALQPDMTDGVSRVQAVLEYSFAVVTYEIRNNSNQLVSAGSLIGNQTTDSLPPGVYTVKYLTTDINGLEGMASFQITVLDTVKPVAQCESLTIQVNPSGLPGDTYVLQASEVDNGSFDNCSGSNLNFQLSQTNFTCGQAGSNFNVTLTVTDAAGNSSSCSAIVSVITTILQPSYDPVCQGGTLHLYANPPSSASSYNWSGPNAFVSNQANPSLPALTQNQGTYCVTVTGLTGCTATGCVTVVFVTLPTQPVISANKVSFCAGENIVLATPTYAGQNVTYQWFLDAMPNPVLVGTTSQPIFTINTPAVGLYRYFVRVSADNCTSVNSNLLTVTVYAVPPAAVDPASISICECQPILLHSSTSPVPGLKYMWMGPGGFSDTVQSPLVNNCAAQIHDGVYTLITKQNGCSSLPATVTVDVKTKPAAPQLTGATKVCEGATVTLLCTQVTGVDYYEWQSPQLTFVTTNFNSLVLNNVMLADSGSWRVRTMQAGCLSEWSTPILVEVQAYPDVTAAANTPLCQGSTLQLSASSDIPLPIDNWAWYGPPNDTWKVFQNPSPTRNPAVSGIYKVVGKTSFGCADSAFVTVNVIDPPVVSSVTNIAPLCADGSKITLQCVVISQNGPFNYSWVGPQTFVSTDAMPMIPNATAANNGTYTVKVYDKYGCMSEPKSTVVSIQDPPVTPTLTSNPNPPAVCAGADVTISISNSNQYPSSNTIYTWLTPTGPTPTTQPFLTVDNAMAIHAGNYFAIVAVTGCISDTSAPVNVIVNPLPPTPVVTANTPLCTGDTLKLSTQLIFGATYSWTGPPGTVFVPGPTVRNPIVPNVTTNNSGNYSVTITLNGCSSSGEGKTVIVKSRPKQPLIKTPVPAACLDQAGSVMTLQITDSSQVQGAQYSWYHEPTQSLVSGPGFAISYQSSNFSGFVPGPNGFYVIGSKDGCNSLPSNVVDVQFDTIPGNVNPGAGPDGEACASGPIQLNADNPAPATGQWTQLTNYSGNFSSAGDPLARVNGIEPYKTYQFVWTLSSGGCKNYASDTVNITTYAPEQALVDVEQIDTCYAKSVRLHAIQGQNGPGYWNQIGQPGLGIYFHNPNDPNTIVDSLTPGNIYYFNWNLDNGACGISTKQVKVVNYGSKANGGSDQVLCRNDSCTSLQADQLSNINFETGLWYSDDPDLEFSSPTSNITSVCNLKRGTNEVIWRTNDGRCGPESYDTVLIVYDLYPTAYSDTFQVDFGTVKNFNVLQNDILPQQYSLTIEQTPSHGDLDTLSLTEGLFEYRPDVTFSGEDVMIYKICNLLCPGTACSSVTVVFQVGSVDECQIFNVVTPNDDGVNDYFFVPCLDSGEISDNEVTIINQWGDVVFHAQPYDNNDPWYGQYKGADLPVGTYFYIVQFNGQTKPKTGFLQLQR